MTANVNFTAFNKKLQSAQDALDKQVMISMVPFMPRNTGTFISTTLARSNSLAGSGIVCAGAQPFGRYLYYGKVMIDKETGKGPMKIPNGPGEYVLRYRAGAELVASKRPLKYSNPSAQPEWFEVAKRKYGKTWLNTVKKEMGGG